MSANAIFVATTQASWTPGTPQTFNVRLPNSGMMVRDLIVFTMITSYVPGEFPWTGPLLSGPAYTVVDSSHYETMRIAEVGSSTQHIRHHTTMRGAVISDGNALLTVSEAIVTGPTQGTWREASIIVTVYRFVDTSDVPFSLNIRTTNGTFSQSTLTPVAPAINVHNDAFVVDQIISRVPNTLDVVSFAVSGTRTGIISGTYFTFTEFFKNLTQTAVGIPPPMPARTFQASTTGPHNTYSVSMVRFGTPTVSIPGVGQWGIAHRSRK